MRIDTKILISYIVLVILSLLMFSCNAKKSTVERTYVSDTLRTASITYKTEPIETNYTIDLICDTITGKIQTVNFKESSGDNSASLIIENNQLKAQLRVAKTQNKTDTIYKKRFRDVLKDEDTLRYKTPLWMWIAIILEAVIIFLLIRYK